MPIDFPNSPSVNDQFTSGTTTWRWDGSVWKVIRDFAPTGATGPTGPTGSVGNTGVTGLTGINWRAAFDFVAYSVGDVVQYSGSTYFCNTAISAGDSTSHIPGSSARWDLLSAKGNTGAQGSTGETGPTGMAFAQTTEPADPVDGLIWIDTDGSVPGQAVVRWSKAPTGGTTSLSGLDDSSVTLSYTAGYEQVYRNGVLLSRGNDYTATSGNSITLIDATITGDIIEVIGSSVLAIADVYTQAQANSNYIGKALTTTTGDIIYASAANTPARLGIGTTGQVLSVASGVPSWATPSSGGMTLIAETVASAVSSIDYTGLSGSYKQLMLVWYGIQHSTTGSKFSIRINADSASNYKNGPYQQEGTTVGGGGASETSIGSGEHAAPFGWYATGSSFWETANGYMIFENPFSTTKLKYYHGHFEFESAAPYAARRETRMFGVYDSASAISEINIIRGAGSATFSNLTNSSIRLYGVS